MLVIAEKPEYCIGGLTPLKLIIGAMAVGPVMFIGTCMGIGMCMGIDMGIPIPLTFDIVAADERVFLTVGTIVLAGSSSFCNPKRHMKASFPELCKVHGGRTRGACCEASGSLDGI